MAAGLNPKWLLGGVALAGVAAFAFAGGGDSTCPPGSEGLEGCGRPDPEPIGGDMRKQLLWAKLKAIPLLDDDQRMFLMLVAYGETGGTWKASSHNDTESEVAASRRAWENNPSLAAELATYAPADRWTIGSGGINGRLGPYFGDDMLDAGLTVDPDLLFDLDHSIVSSVLTAHKLQRTPHWRKSPQTMGALRAGYYGLRAMAAPPADRLAKYQRHVEAVRLPDDFLTRSPRQFPRPSQGKAILDAVRTVTGVTTA